MGKEPCTVLLVDDDETLRAVLAEALEAEGCRVVQAGNGEQGVAAALAQRPSVVISDIVMPEMNGWELCQTLRTLPSTRTVPFVFLSSLDKAPERTLALRLGADDFLTKPFRLDEVLGKVRKILGRLSERDRLLEAGEAAPSGGRLENILVDTVEFLRATRRTGVISVDAGASRGLIYMERGVLKHTVFGRRRGEEALLAMLRLPGSQVAFKEERHENLPANMRLSWEDFMASLLAAGEPPAEAAR